MSRSAYIRLVWFFALGLLAAGLVELWALGQTRFGTSLGYVMLVYLLGALAGGCSWAHDGMVAG